MVLVAFEAGSPVSIAAMVDILERRLDAQEIDDPDRVTQVIVEAASLH